MGAVDHRFDEFVERNIFLHLLLGLASAGIRYDALLAHYGRRQALEALAPSDADPVLLFLVGTASFRARIGHLLEAMRVRHTTAAPSPSPPIGSLLR